MVDFQETTETIDNILSTQLAPHGSWNNIPGELVKVSSSQAGYAWGFNSSNELFRCALPCSGNWELVFIEGVSKIVDLTTDTSTVYVLTVKSNGVSGLMISPSTSTNWNDISLPGAGCNSIFSTHSYVWTQDGSNRKWRCAKPCTTGNWIASPDTSVKITSSNDSSLFGVSPAGEGMKSDETLQTGWDAVTEMPNVNSIVGGFDSIYGLDTQSRLIQCQTGKCDPVDTSGYVPTNVTVGSDIWMTTASPGLKGNIFNKVANADYQTIMDRVTPLDKARDVSVADAEKQLSQQTEIQKFVQYFKSLFKTGNPATSKDDISRLQNEIQDTQAQLDFATANAPFLQKLIMTLLAVVLVYLVGSVLGTLIHTIALVILVGGLMYSFYGS
jgi:hypothetical protein